MPKKRSIPELDDLTAPAADPRLEPLNLAWTNSTFDFHRVPAGSHRLSVAQRLAPAGISIRQDPETSAGCMALFRADHGGELGNFTAKAALEQLALGFTSANAGRTNRKRAKQTT